MTYGGDLGSFMGGPIRLNQVYTVHAAWDGGTLIHFYNLYGSFINIAAIPLNLEILCLRLDAPVVVQLWLKPRDHSKLASS